MKAAYADQALPHSHCVGHGSFLCYLFFCCHVTHPLDAGDVVSAYRPDGAYGHLAVAYPQDGTLFPSDIAAPTFRWSGDETHCDAWAVRLTFAAGGDSLDFLAYESQWGPDVETWETIKRQAGNEDIGLLVLGLQRAYPSISWPGDVLAFASLRMLSRRHFSIAR